MLDRRNPAARDRLRPFRNELVRAIPWRRLDAEAPARLDIVVVHPLGVRWVECGSVLVEVGEHGAIIAQGRRADRRGFGYQPQPPKAATGRSEDAVSINAPMAMRDQFPHEPRATRALFDALVDLLTGDERKH